MPNHFQNGSAQLLDAGVGPVEFISFGVDLLLCREILQLSLIELLLQALGLLPGGIHFKFQMFRCNSQCPLGIENVSASALIKVPADQQTASQKQDRHDASCGSGFPAKQAAVVLNFESFGW